MSNLKLEFRNLNVVFATVVAAIFIFVDFFVWCAAGSPMYVLRFVSVYVPVLPLWVFGLFDFLSFAVLGFSLGAVLGMSCSAYDVYKYRGAFYFIMGVTLAFVHHILLLVGAKFFVAIFIGVLRCFFISVAIVNFYRVSKISAVLSAVGSVWSFYILIFNLLVFFFV